MYTRRLHCRRDVYAASAVIVSDRQHRAKEQGRADDNEETIRKRFEVYHNQTAPLAEWFEKEGMRHTFRWADHPSKEEMIGSIFAFLDQLN